MRWYLDLPDNASWLPTGDRFVYRKSVEGGHEFIMADAATQAKHPAFDQAKLAAALSAASGQSYTSLELPFARFRFSDEDSAIEFAADNTRWRCDLHAWTCHGHPEFSGDDYGYDDTPKAENSADKTMASPDGKWLAYILDYNVHVRSKDGKEQYTLSQDGSEGNYYAFSTMVWSPDSAHLIAYRIRPGYRRLIHYVESSPEDQLQPAIFHHGLPQTRRCAAPCLSRSSSTSVTHREIAIDNTLFPNPYEMAHAVWWKDSPRLYLRVQPARAPGVPPH